MDNTTMFTSKDLWNKLDRLESKVDKISVVLLGNGSKGHEQRLEDIEEWKKTRPKECPAKPLTKGEAFRKRAVEIAIMSLILGSIFTLTDLLLTHVFHL